MANRKGLAAAVIVLVVVGLAVVLGGLAVYLQRNSPISQLPMAPGLPANPDATIGIIAMVMGVVMIASGVCMQFLG